MLGADEMSIVDLLYTAGRPSGTFLWSPLLPAGREPLVTDVGRGKEEACDIIRRGAATRAAPL